MVVRCQNSELNIRLSYTQKFVTKHYLSFPLIEQVIFKLFTYANELQSLWSRQQWSDFVQITPHTTSHTNSIFPVFYLSWTIWLGTLPCKSSEILRFLHRNSPAGIRRTILFSSLCQCIHPSQANLTYLPLHPSSPSSAEMFTHCPRICEFLNISFGELVTKRDNATLVEAKTDGSNQSIRRRNWGNYLQPVMRSLGDFVCGVNVQGLDH